jgi:hypothetical protein
VAILLRWTCPSRREEVLACVLREAAAAADHLSKYGRPHPVWGDGSLMAVVLRNGSAAEPALSDADYCLCLSRVYTALAGLTRVENTQRIAFVSGTGVAAR